MALNEQNGHLFVISQRPSTLRELDGRTLRLQRLLTIAPQTMQAQDVVVDPQRDRLFVVGRHVGASAVTTLALRTGRLIHVTPFPQLIGTVQEDRHTAHLFATSQGSSAQTGTLATLEVGTGAVVRVVPDPRRPGDLVVDERRGRVFVANGDGTIAELRSATGRLVHTFPVSMAKTMRSFAGTLAVDAATGRLIVADPSTDSITVLSPSL
jgi:DNA-binding beta-propeller fold protein YncE